MVFVRGKERKRKIGKRIEKVRNDREKGKTTVERRSVELSESEGEAMVVGMKGA